MYHTKDPSKTGRLATILLWTWLVADAAMAASALNTIRVLGGFGGGIADRDRLNLADRLTQWTSLPYFILFVAAAVAVGRWIYLTNRNAQTFGDGMTITPGWAVGWFFIPVAGLFKPFQGVSATWRTTVRPEAPDTVAVPAALRWWWGLWIVTSLLGNAGFRLSLQARTPAEVITACWPDAISLLIDIPLVVILTRIVTDLSAMQSEVLTRAGRAVDDGDAPAP